VQSKAAKARRIARRDPKLGRVEIARRVGTAPQSVADALQSGELVGRPCVHRGKSEWVKMRIRPDHLRRLQAAARSRGLSMADLVATMIDDLAC
jgi:hypothetical protein